MTTSNPLPAENSENDGAEQKPKTYLESIEYLSGLEFETDKLIDGELPASVSIAVFVTADIFRKSNVEVLNDLTEKRLQEADDVKVDNDLRYSHLGQYGDRDDDLPTD